MFGGGVGAEVPVGDWVEGVGRGRELGRDRRGTKSADDERAHIAEGGGQYMSQQEGEERTIRIGRRLDDV